MQDVLKVLSLARTALDDPAGLPDDQRPNITDRTYSMKEYAVNRIDEAIGLLDVEDRPRQALITMGKLIAEIADDLAGGERGGQEADSAASDLYEALDIIDGVIHALS